MSSSPQKYLQWEFLSCFAFDKISSQLEMADWVASFKIADERYAQYIAKL